MDDGARETTATGTHGGWGWLVAGLALGLFIIGAAALPALYGAYKLGLARGHERERLRALSHEEAIVSEAVLPPEAPGGPAEPARKRRGDRPGPRRPSTSERIVVTREMMLGKGGAPGAVSAVEWVFSPDECIRLAWPMEIVGKGPAAAHPYFRIRQGANRLALPGGGLAEFAFRTDRFCFVTVFARCRYMDDCANTLKCRMDGGPVTRLGGTKVYGRWVWENTYRRFALKPGLHRLTIETSEDGVDFDRVAVSETGTPARFGAARATPPPVFESVPVAAADLPAVGAVSAEAYITRSLVVGRGHENSMSAFLRLNGADAASGRIVVRSALGGVYLSERFCLTPVERTRRFEWELKFAPGDAYFLPVSVQVFVGKECVHAREINFVNPLAWAFLGPIPDPERKGLDLLHPVEQSIGEMGKLPEVQGLEWKRICDGSCYDEWGLVDLNRVFGRANTTWHYGDRGCDPVVAYAVTAVPSWGSHHDSYAYAGDDCLRVWQNGRPLLRVDSNMPIDVSRQLVGTEMDPTENIFVFKVAQTGHYWQILFEPDRALPYGRHDNLRVSSTPWWERLGKLPAAAARRPPGPGLVEIVIEPAEEPAAGEAAGEAEEEAPAEGAAVEEEADEATPAEPPRDIDDTPAETPHGMPPPPPAPPAPPGE